MQKHLQREWIVISCECSPAEEETCSWIFFQNGTLGLEIENLSSGTICLKASFPADTLLPEHIDELRYRFRQAGLDKVARTLKAEQIADQDWMSNWKKYFEPFYIGNAFIICPPWREKELAPEQIGKRKKIIIDPGMAFGTGQHATTKFCLEAIEKSGKGPRILDIGTGSGILAIACATLFPESSILALDIDNQAIINARHNIELNRLEDRIELLNKSPLGLFTTTSHEAEQFDTLLSNLTVEDIIALLPTCNSLLKIDGVFILAGIIEERFGQLEACLTQFKFKILEKSLDRGWVGLALVKCE